jgi:hypothetical protein
MNRERMSMQKKVADLKTLTKILFILCISLYYHTRYISALNTLSLNVSGYLYFCVKVLSRETERG